MDALSCSVGTSTEGKVEGLDVRIAASTETTILPEVIPIAVTPDCVRIKQRKRFFLSSLGVDKETYVYEMSVVYTGKTKSQAEQRQSTRSDPSFEIEIECLQPRAYLRTSNGEDLMLALSLTLKAYDFAALLHPRTNVTYVPHELRAYDVDPTHAAHD